MELKIAMLNLCIGLKNILNDTAQLLSHNEIYILCLQKVEIPYDFAPNHIQSTCFELISIPY